MRGHKPILPPGSELLPLIGTTTLDAIGEQYGVSRQAVWERLDTHCKKALGMGLRQYRQEQLATS